MGGNVIVITSKADWDEKLATAAKEGKGVIVDFFATWCGPCHFIAPTFEEFSKTYADTLFLKVDVDAAQEVAASVGITAMPTFHGYKNGEKVGEVVGANKAGLEKLIEQVRAA